MRHALILAASAAERGEIPIGAVVVCRGKIIGSGSNSNRIDNNPTRHAEIIAIEKACAYMNNERLVGCSLYVTKEPCTMCAGAIIHARIADVYFGANDIKYGACGTVFSVCGNEKYNHIPQIHTSLLAEESAMLLKKFFRRLRDAKN